MFSLHRHTFPAGDPRIVFVALDDDTRGKKYGFRRRAQSSGGWPKTLRPSALKRRLRRDVPLDPREGDPRADRVHEKAGNVAHLYHFEKRYKGRRVYMAVRAADRRLLTKASAVSAIPTWIARSITTAICAASSCLMIACSMSPAGPPEPLHGRGVPFVLFTGVPIGEVQRRWGMPLSRELPLNFRGPRIRQRHPIQYERQAAGATVSVEQLTDIMNRRTASPRRRSMS